MGRNKYLDSLLEDRSPYQEKPNLVTMKIALFCILFLTSVIFMTNALPQGIDEIAQQALDNVQGELEKIDSSDLPSDVQDTLNKAVQGGQNLLNSITGGAGSAATSSLSMLGFSMMALWVAL